MPVTQFGLCLGLWYPSERASVLLSHLTAGLNDQPRAPPPPPSCSSSNQSQLSRPALSQGLPAFPGLQPWSLHFRGFCPPKRSGSGGFWAIVR